MRISSLRRDEVKAEYLDAMQKATFQPNTEKTQKISNVGLAKPQVQVIQTVDA
jgi:hypothetical protein